MSNNSYLEEISRTSSSFLTFALPFFQLGFYFLPENFTFLYINKETFLFTSIITLILSIIIIFLYRAYPYFRTALNKKKENIYLDSLRQHNLDPKVTIKSSPFYLTHGVLVIFSIFLFIITSLNFIWIGLFFNEQTITPWISFGQSCLYILMFVLIVYILTHFLYAEHQKKHWQRSKEKRIQNAIKLAIEHQAFPDIPPVQFISLSNSTDVIQKLLIKVKINKKYYTIFTDMNAELLLGVIEHPEVNN